MIKKRCMVVTAIVLYICTLGCGKTEEHNSALYEKETEVEEQPKLEELFNLEEIEASGSILDGAYSYGLRNIDDESMAVSINEGKLILDIEHDNSGKECEVGFLMFVDGIPQFNASGESMTKFRTETKSVNHVRVETDPIVDVERNIHRLDCMLIFEPTYTGTKEHMEHGNYGSGLPLLPYTVNGIDEKIETTRVEKEFEMEPLSNDLIERYTKERRDGTKRCQIDEKPLIIELREKEFLITDGIVADPNMELQLAFFGKNAEKYRVSAFLNDEAYPAFDGAAYVDIEVTHSNETIVRPNVKYEDLQSGGNNLFFVYIPAGDDDIYAGESAEKTPTYTLLCGE
ncbi:MAG: hypothetical protein J5717_03450 [Lachnospiraceae bacterium]|nr:hypothetical protein [Lachnospiraceae bacterium]MBR5994227.1 hypothetical protein [Lachnospiraceae bacterium]